MCTSAHIPMGICTCKRMWRPEDDLRYTPQEPFTLFFQTVSHWPEPCLVVQTSWPGSPRNLLPLSSPFWDYK